MLAPTADADNASDEFRYDIADVLGALGVPVAPPSTPGVPAVPGQHPERPRPDRPSADRLNEANDEALRQQRQCVDARGDSRPMAAFPIATAIKAGSGSHQGAGGGTCSDHGGVAQWRPCNFASGQSASLQYADNNEVVAPLASGITANDLRNSA